MAIEVKVQEETIGAIGDAVDLLIQARERLEAHTSSKTRLLLDMLLLDLAEQLAAFAEEAKH
ncbi:hypothetical protein FV222_09575 [Methylobacterium sp. WL103]|uniref:hypothetical protein n=1 Tax=Methylobacterium sp. WL103 TaxID=2603891 RepID=UPI0011D7A6B4|nr:hypothetical protein [Methylobacterium sp. WL103]TXM72362.1 hypothetical protein FV226_12580 [Methylobacterium sp. WL12]TXN02432.1 hypothetical protein FV222_09575 [Methylobacterium sp. WL103]TXN10667.1 hypothetical protein FV219_06230 [Methylobacterium sp. WL122]